MHSLTYLLKYWSDTPMGDANEMGEWVDVYSNDALPEQLSELIRIALKDEAKAFKSKHYQVDMNDWHTPLFREGVCEVCLAGAVMAYELGIKPNLHATPGTFKDEGLQRKLSALDEIRQGNIDYSVAIMRNVAISDASDLLVMLGVPTSMEVCEHSYYRLQWRKDMFKIIRMLERAGL